jgi:hypothetical protein
MGINVESFALQIENFMLLLTQKERFVIERRFNLDKKERATLEEIGQHFSVTRERIRQIEKNAINKLKRNLENCQLFEIANLAYEIIATSGNVIMEDLLLSQLLKQKPEYSVEALQLIMSIDKRFSRVPNTVSFHPYLKMNHVPQHEIENICRQTIDILNKSKNTASLDKLYANVVGNKAEMFSLISYRSVIQVDKKIKLLENDQVGLYEWRHINPRTLRDKIYYVLRMNKGPMHFVEIANRIIECKFDKKKINLQAVHNELIRHDEFVLIGRGIYGLSEWGFKSGTVAEVIESILKGKESMSQQEIIDSVLKQRKVKPITVILSLKNKERFIRVGRKQYCLKENMAS